MTPPPPQQDKPQPLVQEDKQQQPKPQPSVESPPRWEPVQLELPLR